MCCGVVCMFRRVTGTCCLHRQIHHPFIRDSVSLWNSVVYLPGCLSTLSSRKQTSQLLLWENEVTHRNFFKLKRHLWPKNWFSLVLSALLFFLPFPKVLSSNLWRDICYPYLRNTFFFSVIACLKIYEGNSISKLQIVIGKNRMEIMTYKKHLFFNIISIQI